MTDRYTPWRYGARITGQWTVEIARRRTESDAWRAAEGRYAPLVMPELQVYDAGRGWLPGSRLSESEWQGFPRWEASLSEAFAHVRTEAEGIPYKATAIMRAVDGFQIPEDE